MKDEAEEHQQPVLGDRRSATIANLLPFGERHELLRHREDPLLLLAEVLVERGGQRGQRLRQRFAVHRVRRERGTLRLRPRQQLGDAFVLFLHPQHQRRVGGRAVEQLRPQQVVLTRVMVVQGGGEFREERHHLPGPGGVAGGNTPDECGQRGELPTEAVVDHHHLAGVGADGVSS